MGVESLKKQAKTYDEVHSIQAKVNHAIYKMIPTSTKEGEEKLKDKIKERDKKQWLHEDDVLKQIADLKNVLDTQGDIADYLWEENKEFEKELTDLKEKLEGKSKKIRRLSAGLAGARSCIRHDLQPQVEFYRKKNVELEGRLKETEESYMNLFKINLDNHERLVDLKENLADLDESFGARAYESVESERKGLEGRLQAIRKHFAKIPIDYHKEVWESLGLGTKKEWIQWIEKRNELLGLVGEEQ